MAIGQRINFFRNLRKLTQKELVQKIGFPDNWSEVYNQWKSRQITGTQAMNLLNLKRNTFYSLIKEYEGQTA